MTLFVLLVLYIVIHSTELVFVTHDTHRTQLRPLYDGSSRVFKLTTKHFLLDLGCCKDTVCIDGLKPPHVWKDDEVEAAHAPRRE